jgi:hypothetical protein
MSDPGTVWLVVSGEYSSYTVWCAFETEALAREYIAAIDAIAAAHPSYTVYTWDDTIDGAHLRVERCQLWSTLPVIGVSERHPADARNLREVNLEPGIELSEDPAYEPEPPPPTLEELRAQDLALAERRATRLRNRPHVS